MADINKFKSWVADTRSNESIYGVYARETFNKPEFNDINGWCEPQTMKMINTAVHKCMIGREEYLEIGSYCGRSIAAALSDNDKRAHVIEPFDKFLPDGGVIKGQWNKNINRFKLLRCRISLHEMICQDFDGVLPPIGVFYYDGNHDAGHTYHGLKKFEQYLSDQAIIIVDDYHIYGGPQTTRWPGYQPVDRPVEEDVTTWVKETKGAELLWVTPWLNGQAIIIYQREKSHG